MKTLLLAFALLNIVVNSNATDIKSKNSTATCISGKVLDINTGETLAGVKIEIAGTNNVVYTDFDGNFKINISTSENIELKASYISYNENILTDVKVGNNSDNKIMVKLTSKK
jgi:hypothetical protein